MAYACYSSFQIKSNCVAFFFSPRKSCLLCSFEFFFTHLMKNFCFMSKILLVNLAFRRQISFAIKTKLFFQVGNNTMLCYKLLLTNKKIYFHCALESWLRDLPIFLSFLDGFYPFTSTEEFARIISPLRDAEKVSYLIMLNARIKLNHLSNFMSYDCFLGFVFFYNHWKILVKNIHWSNVLRNTGNSNLCWL